MIIDLPRDVVTMPCPDCGGRVAIGGVELGCEPCRIVRPVTTTPLPTLPVVVRRSAAGNEATYRTTGRGGSHAWFLGDDELAAASATVLELGEVRIDRSSLVALESDPATQRLAAVTDQGRVLIATNAIPSPGVLDDIAQCIGIEHRALVADVLPGTVGSLHVSCQRCQTAMDVAPSPPAASIRCPQCDARVALDFVPVASRAVPPRRVLIDVAPSIPLGVVGVAAPTIAWLAFVHTLGVDPTYSTTIVLLQALAAFLFTVASDQAVAPRLRSFSFLGRTASFVAMLALWTGLVMGGAELPVVPAFLVGLAPAAILGSIRARLASAVVRGGLERQGAVVPIESITVAPRHFGRASELAAVAHTVTVTVAGEPPLEVYASSDPRRARAMLRALRDVVLGRRTTFTDHAARIADVSAESHDLRRVRIADEIHAQADDEIEDHDRSRASAARRRS